MQFQRPRRGLLHTAWLTALAGTLIVPVLALGDDSSPVELQALQFTPSAIDTTTGAAQVTLNFTARDAVSGVNFFEAGFVDASGVARQSASARFARSRSAANSVRITFPKLSTAGTWPLAQVFLGDAAGNTLVLDYEGLVRRGFPTRLEVTTAKDTVSPQLTALGFSPAEIDTSGGPVDVKVNYTATDDLSGVSYVDLSFVSPSGARRGRSAKLEASRSASNAMDVTFPRFSEAGPWTLSSVLLADAAGNTLVLNSEDLARVGFPTILEVKSATDTVSPKLTSLRFTPQMIDTSRGPATVKVDFTAIDDLSGVKWIEIVFVSPSGSFTQKGSAVFAPANEVSSSVDVIFPQSSEPGVWKFTSVIITDGAGNSLVLNQDAMASRVIRVQ